MLRNPFVAYLAAFGAVLSIYQLGWSDIYPALSWDTLLFFGATFLAAVVFGIVVFPLVDSNGTYHPGLLPKYTGLFVVATFAGEIMLAGGIPLLRVIGGEKFYTLEAGASHLHVFMLWSVFSTIRFADFMFARKWNWIWLIEAVLPVIFYGLLVYRGPALICVISWGFVYIIRFRGIRLTHVAAILALAIGALWLNGILGDVRSPGQEYAGAPSHEFRESDVPQTFFWGYLYATLGVANLQLSVDRLEPGQGTVPEFIAADLLPDTISKHILPKLDDNILSDGRGLETRDWLYTWEQPQVSPGLNVSTIFGRAYGFFGWLGPAIMFAALSFFIVAYLILIRRSPYQVPSLALLNTMVVLCIFNNMIASAAMLPLLILVLILPPWRWQPL